MTADIFRGYTSYIILHFWPGVDGPNVPPSAVESAAPWLSTPKYGWLMLAAKLSQVLFRIDQQKIKEVVQVPCVFGGFKDSTVVSN